MLSLSKQLSSLRDDRNKNLKRFISHYKSNIKWNNIEVYKAWVYILSINNQFDKCESLFSEIIHGSSLLSLNKPNDQHEDSDLKMILFNESKDVDFLTSDQLDHLNSLIRTFIDLSVPYFLSSECQHLIGYLIYKYNIAVTFSEYLIVANIQYHYSKFYCKLLSLLTIRNESTFHSLYNEMKSVSDNFTQHKYITSNVVLSGIAKNFSLYKQISYFYDRLSRVCTMNTNIISFLNTLNFHYVIVNSKVMDNNEIRYVVNMLKDALSHVESIEYVSSYLCLLITMFTHIQFTVAVQRELIISLKPIMSLLTNLEVLKIDHLIVFKYIIMSIHLMLQYQKQTLDKLPNEITNSLIDILQKHESVNIVFNNLKQIKGFDFSRTINVTLNSLVTSILAKSDIQKELLAVGPNYKIPSIDSLHFFLKFVNELFDSSCMKMIVFNLIDEVNRISSHLITHGDSIIEFDESRMLVNIKNNHKFSSTLILLDSVFKFVKNINPKVLEYTITDYLNTLSYDMLQDQIEVIMYIFRSISQDIMFRMLILLNNFSKPSNDYNDSYISLMPLIVGNNVMLNMFGLIKDQNIKLHKDDKLFSSIVEFIISMYIKTESHTPELNQLVFNFINISLNEEVLSIKLESNHRFWKTVPVSVSIDSLLYHIQSLIDRLDFNFKYGSENKVPLETVDFNNVNIKDYKYIFTTYANHISKSKEIVRIFKIYKLIEMINNDFNVQNHEINISKSLIRFIKFLTILGVNKTNDYKSENNNLLDDKHLKSNELFDEKELIEFNNDILNILSYRISEINNDTHVEYENENGYSRANYGNFEISNRIIFNIFLTLFYQYATLQFMSNSDGNLELLHSQFVLIIDLIVKYVTNNVDTQNIKDFVIDFYKFMMCKYGSMLFVKSNRFNEITLIKSIETIISNNSLNSYFKMILPELFSMTDGKLFNFKRHLDIIKLIIEVIRIKNITHINRSFSISYLYDNNENLILNVNIPINYKYKYLNVDFVKLIRQSNLKHLLSTGYTNTNSIVHYFNDDINNEIINRKCKILISLFDNINDELVDNCLEVIFTIFKMTINNELSPNLLFEVFINMIYLIFDSSNKYSNNILKMFIELGKLCQNTIVTVNELELPLSYIQNNKYQSIVKNNFLIKYDMKMILNDILLKHNNNVDTCDHFTNVISEYLIKDIAFFNLFISKVFISSNIIYNSKFLNRLCSTIVNCNHSLDVFFSLLDSLIDYLYNILAEENNDLTLFVTVFLDVFERYSLMLYAFSQFNQLNSINNFVKYVEHCTHLLNMCSIFISIKTELINKCHYSNNGYNEISEINSIVNNSITMFEKITFVLLHSLNKGNIWNLPIHYRNRLYFSFALYYSHSKPNYLNTLIKAMFEIKDVDDKVLLVFINYLLSTLYRDDVVLHIINNIKSIKTYEIMIYIIKKNSNIDIQLKINFFCKIINNFLVSTDIENKNVQSFLFTNLNNLIDVYLKLISDYNYNDFYLNLMDRKLEKELKLLNMSLYEKNDINQTKYNLPTHMNQIINDFKNKSKNDSNHLDDDDIISVLSIIVNQVNGMIDNIYSMDLNKLPPISKMFNELYHNCCTLINNSITKYFQSYKLMKKLINNLIVCSIRIQKVESTMSFEQSVCSTVIVTITNILGDHKSEVIGDLVNILIDENESSFADDNIYVTWMSFLIYLYFNVNKNYISKNIDDKGIANNDVLEHVIYQRHSKITDILNRSDKWIIILYNIIWIHQVMVFDPVNKYGLQINKFIRFDSNKILVNTNNGFDKVDCDFANELYGYISYYIQNNIKLNINFDVEFFNNRNSDNKRLFIELNELLYSLLSSIVFYKYSYIRHNKHFKDNESKTIRTTTGITSILNLITTSIVQIFNNNQLGVFNLYIYGILNTLFDNKLDEIVKSIESSENVWDIIDISGVKYHFHLNILSTLMSLQNKNSPSMNVKDNTIMIKYERELERFHNISSRTLFDFFKQSEKIYLTNENDVLFNQISYMKADVWEYFVNVPPKSVDSFIEILENSFDLILNHNINNGKLLWSYLDMIYSLKLMIKMSTISNKQKFNSNNLSIPNISTIKKVGVNDVIQIGGIETKKLIGAMDINDSNNVPVNQYNNHLTTNYTIDTNKMIKSIRKFMEVYDELLSSNKVLGEFINQLFLLFLLFAHKYCNSILNKEFYEFSLKIILNYYSYSSISNSMIFDNVDDEMINNVFNEFLGFKIDECINLITGSSTKRFKYFNRELLICHVFYYTSIKIDIKSLIRSIYSVYTNNIDYVESYNQTSIAGTVVSKNTKKSKEFKQTKLTSSSKKTKTTSLETTKSNTNSVLSDDSSHSENDDVKLIVYKLTILLLSLSYNIGNKKPKSKYIDDLNHIYFIVVNIYSKYSYKLLFGKSVVDSFYEYNTSHFSIEDIVESSTKLSTSFFINNTSIGSFRLFERSFVSFILKYFGLISSNNLLDILEKQSKMSSSYVEFTSDDKINTVVESDLKSRLLFIVILSSLHEYGNIGATNLIMTRLYQTIEDLSYNCLSESRINIKTVDKELSFQNTWSWFNNFRFILQLIQKSIDTWNHQRGSVPDVIVNSWVKIIKNFISIFDILPINAEIEVDNITTASSKTLETTLISLVNGFITQDDKIIKIESCLSDQLTTKSLNVKIGSLVIMNKLWYDHGVNLSLTIKNVMPIIGELVDDENEIVRRLAIKLDEKVKEVLYQN